MGRLPLLSTMSDNKSSNNFMFFPEWGWMIIVGLLLAILVLMDVVPGKASELSGEIIESSYVLDSFSDSGILSGSDRLVLAYDKYYNPSGNPTGSLSVTYPMSAGSFSSWTGTWTRTGFSRTEFSVVQGLISNLDDSAHRVYISQENWVQSLNLKSLNKEDDSVGVLYFDSFNNIDLYGYYAIENFGVQTTDLEVFISDNIIQVQGDAALYKWVSGSWVLVSSVISQNLMNSYPVSTVIKSDFLSVKLDGGSSVDIMCSSFSLDSSSDPEDPDDPDVPISSEPTFSFILYGRPFWSQSLVPNLDNRTVNYYLVDVFASNIFSSLDVALQYNTALAVAMSNYNVESPFIRPVVIQSYNSTDNSIYFYFAGTLSAIKIYTIGTVLPSHNKDLIRQSYTAVDWSIGTDYGSSFYAGSSNGLNVVSAFLTGSIQYGTSFTPQIIDLTLSGYGDLSLSGRPIYNAQSGSVFNYASTSVDNPLTQAYRAGMTNSSVGVPSPTPSPTPDPNATPTPTPDPTPPTVIIQWPTTPTPTPFIDINIPSSPGGDLDGDSTDGILSTGFEFIRTGGSPGLLSTAFSFVPDELQYLIWFLIFLLIILATIKLILHFGG